MPPPTTPDPRGAAELRLRRPGGVEDADPLVVGEAVDREAPVLRAGGEQHGARGDLVVLLEPHDVAPVSRLERDRAVGRRRPRVELARLGDGAAGELGAADAGGEAEVVLDPARRARLPAERGALDDERVESLGGAVDGGAEAGGAAADDEQVDLLSRRELAADPERARDLARRGRAQLGAAGQAHEGQPRPSAGSSSCQVNGRRLLRAKSSIRIVASDERGPTISRPRPSTVCSASRRAMKVDRTRSLSGPSSNSSSRSTSRSTAM